MSDTETCKKISKRPGKDIIEHKSEVFDTNLKETADDDLKVEFITIFIRVWQYIPFKGLNFFCRGGCRGLFGLLEKIPFILKL